MSLNPFLGLYSSLDSPVRWVCTIMFCYCFMSIFATELALPFFFRPPFSLCPAGEVWFEWSHPQRYCHLQQHHWLSFVRQHPWGWRGDNTWRYCCVCQGSLHPSWASPLASPERAVPYLMPWVLCAWRVLNWDTTLQILSFSFTPLQGWTSQALFLCIRLPLVWREGLESVFRWSF